VAFVAMGALEGPSNNVARRAAKAADVGDAAGDVARRVDDVVEATTDVPGNRLLPGELEFGEFGKLGGEVGDDITGHHMPPAGYMRQKYGIAPGDALAMNMEHPFPGKGGRHRATRTYGRPTSEFIGEMPRQALARDIADVRRIYMEQGLYTPDVRRILLDYVALSKQKFPELFLVRP